MLEGWMAEVDCGRTLSELTLPGTHDSGALRGGPRLRTQALEIPAQLDAGIRFLDIRLVEQRGAFGVFHGGADQRTELRAGVLGPIATFLARQPGETVVMSVSQEDGADPEGFGRAFEEVVAGEPGLIRTVGDFPRLGDVRGRIVLLRRYLGALGIAAPPALWRDDATFALDAPGGRLQIEDEWRVPGPWALGRKSDAVERNLAAAAAGSPGDWYLTFTSATSDFMIPRWIARGIPLVAGINDRLLEHLRRSPPGRRGTVVMDFPDERVVEALVAANRRTR